MINDDYKVSADDFTAEELEAGRIEMEEANPDADYIKPWGPEQEKKYRANLLCSD